MPMKCYELMTVRFNLVTGINKFASCAAIFIVCIAYSSIGGLKAVLWSDAMQAIIMIGSVIVVIAVGANEIGGFGVVFDRAKAGGRLDVWNFDIDPRTRHTFWTGIIAAYFSWIPLFAGAQAQIQRYLAVPTVEKAKQCLFFNLLGLLAVVSLCCLAGLVIYAKYYDCDPASVNGVTSTDQLLPLFVMDVMGTYTCLPGLMVAGLTCGSLSSVSSALNALPAIICEDYIKTYKPDISDVKLGYLAKLISAGGGVISFALIFVIALIGNVLPFASLLHGTFLGPVCALFSLGMFFPFANSLGSILGAICSLALTLFIGIGSIVEGNAEKLSNQKLDLRTDGCYINETINSTIASPYLHNSETSLRFNTDWKEIEYDALHNLLGMSYLWLPAITVVSAIVLGLVFSMLLNMWKKSPPVKAKFMTPIIVSMWVKILGEKKVSEWIDFHDEDEREKDRKISIANGISYGATLSEAKTENETCKQNGTKKLE
ncbi:unnamed protein product [Orchesella dallaii]|uniref:Sodium-coupled monocarboxylate transporter 1 n=1 Tax=Orchesella dallaii TaxID=48710 RepID=A0ABP1QVC7_9HEXA